MSLPIVSVIIPCYRQAHYLPAALESVFAQTYLSVEIVVVNDGSDDDTEVVARRYADRIRYVWKPNGGLSSARNAGIAAATGDYLLFLDADDLLHPDAISRLIEAVQHRPDRICLMGSKLFTNPDTIPQERECLPAATNFFPGLIHANLGPCHAFLCSKQRVLQVGLFDEGLRSCEDWDLWARLALAGCELVTVAFAGAYYRKIPGSMSSHSLRMLEMRIEVLLRIHRALAADRNLYSQWGHELLVAACRVRRRAIVQKISPAFLQSLTQCIHQLREAGFRPPQSLPKRFLDRCFGSYAETMALSFLRLAQPRYYAYYRHGYC